MSSPGSAPTDFLAPGTSVPGYLAGTVAEAARRFGNRPAFVDPDGTQLSFAALHKRSDETAAGLEHRRIGVGSVVALTLRSQAAWVVAYAAAAKVGATVAGVNPRLTAVERDACLNRVTPDLVIDHSDDVNALRVRGGRSTGPPNDPDRPVAVVFTSGTTGTPKGAWYTDRQLTAITAFDVGDRWGDEPFDQYGSTQFAHIGFTTKLPWYLRKGSTTHLLRHWRASEVLDLIERQRIRTIGGVAPQVALMLRDPDFDSRDLGCVQLLVMGGAPSPPPLVREARDRFGAAYSIRWSSTESGGVGSATAPDAPDHEALHSVGRPRPGIDVTVRDAAGAALPPGEVGELWLRSPAVMSGYWRDPEATATALDGGWLRTGDLGCVDASGLITLRGRIGEMYIRGGYNVFPSEVVAALLSHPAVAEAAVAPRADPVLGEIGVAVVVPADPARPPRLEDLRTHAARSLAHHKLPEALVVVPDLPLTAMQKLDRSALRRVIDDSPSTTDSK